MARGTKMSNRVEGYFWRGPLRSVANAERIVKITGTVFAVFAGFTLLPIFLSSTHLKMALSNATVALTLGLPAALLLFLKSRAAAFFLVVLTLLVGAGSTITMIALGEGSGASLMSALPMLLFWGLLAWIAGRALKATRGLKRLAQKQQEAASQVEEVFD